MTPPTVARLVASLRRREVLRPQQLEAVTQDLQGKFSASPDLARELVTLGWLTPYQAQQLLHGKGKSLRLGQYILLEPLGEGGMGQVFKGRHRRLDRIDALKIIRPENLDSPQAVARFYREIRTAAQLSHPNVVHAYNADQVGGVHFFAMEYVDGPDLSRCVKQFGPVPVRTACDYIRQAALGLQHAFERGLVHRDIKPANLLVTRRGGVVKVLDMGLAQLSRSEEDDSLAGKTHEGTVVGTLDFLSPEQAMNSALVDIRSDLYSLGCTFYFLLTGQVPFAGGSPLEKLARHRWAEPTPIESLRPEVEPAVQTILRQLLAKEPSERIKTPAELAARLGELTVAAPPQVPLAIPVRAQTGSGPIATAVERPVATPNTTTLVAVALEDTSEDWDAILAAARQSDPATAGISPSRLRRQAEERRNQLLLMTAVGVGVFLLLCFLLFTWWVG